MSEHRFVETDELTPTSIRHQCEEIWDGDRLQQRYNYLVYTFDAEGLHYWARAYFDEIDEVSLFGPFENEARTVQLAKPLNPDILDYLKRRFRSISVLGAEGYEEIWNRDS